MSSPSEKDRVEAAKFGEKREWLYYYAKQEMESPRSFDETADLIQKQFGSDQHNDIAQRIKDHIIKEMPGMDLTKEYWQIDGLRQLCEDMNDESINILRKMSNKELDCDTAWRMWCEANPDETRGSKEEFTVVFQMMANEPVSKSDCIKVLASLP